MCLNETTKIFLRNDFKNKERREKMNEISMMMVKPHANMYFPHPPGALQYLIIHNHEQPEYQAKEDLAPLQLHLIDG